MASTSIAASDIPSFITLAAGFIYILNFKKLKGFERLIMAVILLNVAADSLSVLLIEMKTSTHIVYNIACPIERVLILIVYAKNAISQSSKRIYNLGLLSVLLTSFLGAWTYSSITEFHYIPYVISGLIVAVLSYIHLRSIALDKAGQSFLIVAFSLANLVYFTLMVSAMSSLQLALRISNDFASQIFNVNLIAYALWSIILIIGILWKKRQKT